MRLPFALHTRVLSLLLAFAQTKEIDDAIKQKLATARWVTICRHQTAGSTSRPQDPNTSAPAMRATNGP